MLSTLRTGSQAARRLHRPAGDGDRRSGWPSAARGRAPAVAVERGLQHALAAGQAGQPLLQRVHPRGRDLARRARTSRRAAPAAPARAPQPRRARAAPRRARRPGAPGGTGASARTPPCRPARSARISTSGVRLRKSPRGARHALVERRVGVALPRPVAGVGHVTAQSVTCQPCRPWRSVVAHRLLDRREERRAASSRARPRARTRRRCRPAPGSTRSPTVARNGLGSVADDLDRLAGADRALDADRGRLAERDVDAVVVGERRLDDLLLHLAVERDASSCVVVLAQVDQRVLLGELGERDVQRAAVARGRPGRRPSPASAARSGGVRRPARARRSCRRSGRRRGPADLPICPARDRVARHGGAARRTR